MSTISIEYLIVGGGGGGGGSRGVYTTSWGGGGGGGGGEASFGNATLDLGNTYQISIGAGGQGGTKNAVTPAANGGSSSLLGPGIALTAIGGGAGGTTSLNNNNGYSGASGGGAVGDSSAIGGLGTAGFDGGNTGSSNDGGGGGGGAAGTGGSTNNGTGGAGGPGITSSITGSLLYYAAGGGGGSGAANGPSGGAGGSSIGGRGASINATNLAEPGEPNTGSGGGGGADDTEEGVADGAPGSDGIVIIRYFGSPIGMGGEIISDSGYTVHIFKNDSEFSVGDALTVSDNNLTYGKVLTVTLLSLDAIDNTEIPYTITGIDSSDISGAPLSGNFNIVNGTSSIDFTATPSGKKTLSIESKGFTETVDLVENIYGLSQSSDESNETFTSVVHPGIIDLSDVSYALDINILTIDDLYEFAKIVEESVTTTDKNFVSTDFVSITNFNVPEPEPITFQERWAG